ncbi:hypothetical protein BGZ60DRAFT_534481 [Tricladium varicosporioides]|nr:hypothetical protein BGZ60DRAFT_534481 [Hymenoscyphus varicosporioides]
MENIDLFEILSGHNDHLGDVDVTRGHGMIRNCVSKFETKNNEVLIIASELCNAVDGLVKIGRREMASHKIFAEAEAIERRRKTRAWTKWLVDFTETINTTMQQEERTKLTSAMEICPQDRQNAFIIGYVGKRSRPTSITTSIDIKRHFCT